jgi:radical SAM enzyme (TIGR01210 family)
LTHIIDFFKTKESIKEINIESLPNFVKPKIIAYIQHELHYKMLSISMGWETSNESVRKNIWQKQISNKMYEKALTVINEFDKIHAKYFVLIGLPDASEQESIDECLTSVRKALENGNISIELQPTSVMEGTIVEKYYYEGRFLPISISSLLTIAKEVKKYFEQRETYVGKFCVSTNIKPEPMVENTSAKQTFKKFNASMQKIWEEEILQNWHQNINHDRYMRKINKIFDEFN